MGRLGMLYTPFAADCGHAILNGADLSLRPPLLRGEGESNERCVNTRRADRNVYPTFKRFRDGSTSHCAAAELIDWRIKQLTVTFHELIRLGG